ncbi:FAD-dependent oxidoreductase [Psychromonas sp. Urea-02u-13]|uniref:FAD-dependent oxidoreductase n=1 Tax=Psychromonas sp. Urea-02u-13 TaxID=2058326 RepID=UPI000C33C0C8|nr:FAD-dependent oxidoreductase [Psychromonas sp. Urea-02u-13]PKG38944.1 FAD-dependent oxidoreductase [Psychromonas sp. Urea-02u-13]
MIRSQKKYTESQLHIAVIGAGISGLTIAHQCIKQGYRVSVYEKESSAGGKCMGHIINGKVHELTHRQIFAKNKYLLSLLKEIPTETGTCLDYIHSQKKVQFHWGKTNKTIQFQRSYFSTIEKWVDNAKSAYSMLYAKVSLNDIYWFKQRALLAKVDNSYIHIPISEYFQYRKRPQLANFLRPMLSAWIGATDDTATLSVLDLLRNKEGMLHPESPHGYSLGFSIPISQSVIEPWYQYLKTLGVKFHFNNEVASIINHEATPNHATIWLNNGDKLPADYFVLAIPAHIIQQKLSSQFGESLALHRVFSHGFQLHFNQLPQALNEKTVGIVIDSPWGLSYSITYPECQHNKNRLVCLSITATNMDTAIGCVYDKPLLLCSQTEVQVELLTQLMGNTQLLDDPGFVSFHIGPGATIVPRLDAEHSNYSDWHKGNTFTDEDGVLSCWVIQHSLAHPTYQNKMAIHSEEFDNLFFTGECIVDAEQTWRVPATLERTIETAILCHKRLTTCIENMSNTR